MRGLMQCVSAWSTSEEFAMGQVRMAASVHGTFFTSRRFGHFFYFLRGKSRSSGESYRASRFGIYFQLVTLMSMLPAR